MGVALFACRGGSGAAPAADTGVPMVPPSASLAQPSPTVEAVAPKAPGEWPGPPVQQKSAPRAPARTDAFKCAAPRPGTPRYYPRNHVAGDCVMRGGYDALEDSPALKAAGHHPVSLCKDTDCTTDAQCGADRVCACAPADGKDPEVHNRCIFGNCTSDTDCGGFACVETYALGIPTQPKEVHAVIGRYCRSANDTCTSDQACSTRQRERCIFVEGAFRCRASPL